MYEDKIGRRIYNKFGIDKTIVGIKNSSAKFKYMNSFLWIIPLTISLALLINIVKFMVILEHFQIIFMIIGFIVVILIAIIIFLGSCHTIYFENDFLILKNKLNMKKYIDINKHPQIYIRRHTYTVRDRVTETFNEREMYILYIEQENTKIKLNLRIKAAEQIINNLIVK